MTAIVWPDTARVVRMAPGLSRPVRSASLRSRDIEAG